MKKMSYFFDLTLYFHDMYILGSTRVFFFISLRTLSHAILKPLTLTPKRAASDVSGSFLRQILKSFDCDGIQVDVARKPAFIQRALYELRLVPALKKMARLEVLAVHFYGERGQKTLHESVQIRQAGPELEMKMIRHQAVTMNVNLVELREISELFKKQPAIAILIEYNLSTIAAVDHMIASSIVLHA